jgi:hypothetical protein
VSEPDTSDRKGCPRTLRAFAQAPPPPSPPLFAGRRCKEWHPRAIAHRDRSTCADLAVWRVLD